MSNLTFFALSGSLRNASHNTRLLKALKLIAPAHINIVIFDQLEQIPPFNPDREEECIPIIESLNQSIKQADGLIIASPEYAHGVSGVLKNALDWMVSKDGFIDKPAILMNTSPRAHIAQDALKEILTTMSAKIIEEACLNLPLLGTADTEQEIAQHPEWSVKLKQSLQHYENKIRNL